MPLTPEQRHRANKLLESIQSLVDVESHNKTTLQGQLGLIILSQQEKIDELSKQVQELKNKGDAA